MRVLERWVGTPLAWIWQHVVAAPAVWVGRHVLVWAWQHIIAAPAVWVWRHVAARMTAIAVAIIGGAVTATFGLHALLARSGSNDAWAAAIEAVAAVVLVLVTAWYVYLTYGLLAAQRSGPRMTAWETALRDLSTFIARNDQVFWTTAAFFPVDTSVAPPNMVEIFKSRDALHEVRNHLMETFALLPEQFAKLSLLVLVPLVEAEQELHSLAYAITEENQAGLDQGRDHVTWDGIQQRHEASDDPARQEPWHDILAGKWVKRAQEAWDAMSDQLMDRLR